MGRGLRAAAAATAAVFVGGARVGSAVLIDDRHLLTAAHVLSRRRDGEGGPSKPVEVLFPSGLAPDSRIPATPISRAAEAGGDVAVDAAVIALGEQPPAQLPRPVPLWPAA